MTNTTNLTRAFIGINPTPPVLEFYQQFQQRHADAPWAQKLRWTKPENIHITMRFLGAIDPAQLEQISTQLDQRLVKQKTIPITLTSPQPFPSLKKARMLASLVQKNDQLEQLAGVLETIAVDADLEPETRPFRGHVTVGRFRKPVRGLQDLLQDPSTVSMDVDHVILFKSELKSTGAEYTQLKNLHFK
jgi:2'-5' RNA ligase